MREYITNSMEMNGDEFEQTPRDNERQGSLARCSPWGCKELDKTQPLNNNSYRREGSNKTATASEQSTFRVKAEGKRESSSEIKKGFSPKNQMSRPRPVNLVLKRQKGSMYFKNLYGLGVPWWYSGTRICLPMQGTWVRSLVWEDSTCRRQLRLTPQILSLCSRAHEPQLLKPTHLEPVLSKGEACRLPTKSSPYSLQLEKTCRQQARPRETKQ